MYGGSHYYASHSKWVCAMKHVQKPGCGKTAFMKTNTSCMMSCWWTVRRSWSRVMSCALCAHTQTDQSYVQMFTPAHASHLTHSNPHEPLGEWGFLFSACFFPTQKQQQKIRQLENQQVAMERSSCEISDGIIAGFPLVKLAAIIPVLMATFSLRVSVLD